MYLVEQLHRSNLQIGKLQAIFRQQFSSVLKLFKNYCNFELMYVNFDLYTLTLNNTTFIIMYPAKMSRNFFKIEMWGCRFPWGVGWFITSEQLRHLGDNRDQEDAFRPGSGPDVRCLIEERLLVRVVYLQYLLARRQQLICIYMHLHSITHNSFYKYT